MGGNQEVPGDATYVRVHKSVKIITASAFQDCLYLVSIELHDGVEIIEEEAFNGCESLIEINLSGVRVIEDFAFCHCSELEYVEFGDNLESIGISAFYCTSLRNINLPKVRVIRERAFEDIWELTAAELSEDIERIESSVFSDCRHLRRIAMPLKDNIFGHDVFIDCRDLSQVDLIGGIHKTISSLLLECWRNEIKDEIDQINRDLPNSPTNEKTAVIQRWVERVLERMEHYKPEHYTLLKNDMTQLELALWDANLPNVDAAASRSRHDARVTCGANIIIPHVLSFLNDEEVFPTVRTIPF